MQLTLVDSGDLKAISRALRHHADGKRLRKELITEFKEIAEPLARNVRIAWRSAPSKGRPKSRDRRRYGDLRELLARSTWVQVRFTGKEAGIHIRSDGRKMPDEMKALGAYAEGIRQRGRWRHPVFADRDTWAQQRSWPRFYAAARVDESKARFRANEAVDRIFDEIVKVR